MAKFEILENKIANLEIQIRTMGLLGDVLATERTHGCTNGCTGACPDPTGNCTYDCTRGCTNGCSGACEAVATPDLAATPTRKTAPASRKRRNS